jgi:hypothetical protein
MSYTHINPNLNHFVSRYIYKFLNEYYNSLTEYTIVNFYYKDKKEINLYY